MLRAFTIATRKLLLPRPLPVYTPSSDAATSSSTAIDDEQRRKRVANHQAILPISVDHNGHRLLGLKLLLNNEHKRWASGKKGFQVPDPSVIACNMISMLKCIDLKNMKDSPSPTFWVSLATGGAQVVIPLLEIIGGYSDVLTVLQLHLAALTVAYLSGNQWGLAISKNTTPQPTWDTMNKVITPTLAALLGLVLPYPLGFITVGAAQISRLYMDLKACVYPAWALAERVFLTLTTLVGLSMALIAYLLFHNAEDKNKKDKKKGAATQVDEEEDDDNEKKDESKSKNGK